MEGLTGEQFEAVGNELPIFGIDCPFADFRPVVAAVVEQGMPDPVEMYPYLMGSSCLKPAFHHCDISEPFKHLVVCHSPFPPVSVRKDLESEPVARISPYIALDGAFIFLDVAPHDGYIPPVDGMYEELFGKIELCLVVLRHHQKA